MLIQTYQLLEPNVAKKFHDDGDRNNDHNDHDGDGHHIHENDDENHHRDYDIHSTHENDDENHDHDYDVHYVHENVLHDDVFLHFFFDSIIDSILV